MLTLPSCWVDREQGQRAPLHRRERLYHHPARVLPHSSLDEATLMVLATLKAWA